jgi:hypothetical protein
MLRRLSIVAFFGLSLVFSSPSVHAEVSAQDEAMAQQLFDEGKVLEQKKDWKGACDKFEASQRLSPAPGTQLKLGVCHAELGMTATAYGELIAARSRAKKDNRPDRIQVADTYIAKIEPILSKLTIVLALGAEVSGLTMRLDGHEIDRGILGAAVPVDPGDHTLEASAPDRQKWTTTIHVGTNADARSVTIPVLEIAPKDSAPTTSPLAPAPSSTRTVGWIVAGSGVAVGLVGVYFTLHALSLRSDAENMNATDPTGAASKNDSARSALTIGRIGLGAGVIAMGVGTYLVFAGASSSTSATTTGSTRRWTFTPWVASTSGGMSLQGSW